MDKDAQEIIKLAQALKDKCNNMNCSECPFHLYVYGNTCELGMIDSYGKNYTPRDWDNEYIK